MKQLTKLIGTLALVGLGASSAHAETRDFAAGSLIIPASSVFQTDCGAVSMYGLVYSILRANEWLDADPGYTPIEVYYSYRDDKGSTNRCTPTNKHPKPTTAVKWDDGCDFSLTDPSNTTNLVTLINNATASPDGVVTTINTNGKATVYPTYNLAQAINVAGGVNKVSYSGGSFIIDQSDVATFLGLIRGTITAKDNGNNISFANWRPTTAGAPSTCVFNTSGSNAWQTSSVGGWVNIHRANVSFTAPIPKVFDSSPPRLALLALDKNNRTGTLTNDILQGYLSRAGLTFTGSRGCPTGSPHATNTGQCPNGAVSGEIYDTFDIQDVIDGKLMNQAGGENVYKMFWAPHWELKSSTSGPTAQEQTAVANLSQFLDGKHGLMAECASVDTLEGSQRMVTGTQGKFQTCTNNGSGVCSAAANSRGLTVNSGTDAMDLQPDPWGGTGTYPRFGLPLRNCSDPNMTTNADCYYIGYPTDPYVQIADYRWYNTQANVADFLPRSATNSMYRPGVLPLISGVTALDLTKLSSPAVARASGMIRGDYVSRSMKDNNDDKSNILYMGGHDLTASVSGTKVILLTLLQLGTPDPTPIIKEITRSTPIFAAIGLVQGTYEAHEPATGIAKKLVIDGDAAGFEFPFVQGHLRVYTGVTTAATAFDDIAATWDAATLIPTANYAGCTPYTSACRTVFTNTVANCGPTTTPCTNVVLSDTTATTVGPLMASDLTPASQKTLVRRTLEGIVESSAPNGYKARLGGIDRSTIALIEDSPLAGAAAERPLMVYVGGSDGMLHAICANDKAPCSAPGVELWAFLPRTQLTRVRTNTTMIQGSPRVQDVYGDFEGTGQRSYRTVLVFQTGTGDSTVAATSPAIYALDISKPGEPKLLWEHTTAGQGIAITMGRTSGNKLLAFAQTNSGTTTSGSRVVAVNVETGLAEWTNSLNYPLPSREASSPIPSSGVPGGAVALDLNNGGTITDVVFNTLYGETYRLNANTGTSVYPGKALFSFSQDLKPFGAAPAIFNDDGVLYAVSASGGYMDPNTATNGMWTSTAKMQQAVGVRIDTDPATVTLNENKTPKSPADLRFVYNMGAGQLSYSQAQIIGGQIFVTTDVTDINATTYGMTAADTGQAHRLNIDGANGVDNMGAPGWSGATVVSIMGGAASVGHSGTDVIASTADRAKKLNTLAADGTTGGVVNNGAASTLTRRLWLRTL